MINSATGQAVGILLPFWSYLPTGKVSPKGFLYPVWHGHEGRRRPKVRRPDRRSQTSPPCGQGLLLQDALKRLFRPKFFCAGVLPLFKGRICNFTGIHAQKADFISTDIRRESSKTREIYSLTTAYGKFGT